MSSSSASILGFIMVFGAAEWEDSKASIAARDSDVDCGCVIMREVRIVDVL